MIWSSDDDEDKLEMVIPKAWLETNNTEIVDLIQACCIQEASRLTQLK